MRQFVDQNKKKWRERKENKIWVDANDSIVIIAHTHTLGNRGKIWSARETGDRTTCLGGALARDVNP